MQPDPACRGIRRRRCRADHPDRFALDWRFEGPAAPYFVAIDKG
jgi:hypothetical protein